MIDHKWALFLDFHSLRWFARVGCILSYFATKSSNCGQKEKKKRSKAAAVQSWNNQSINMHIQVARMSFKQVGKVWVALPPSDTENYTGIKNSGGHSFFTLFRRVGCRHGFRVRWASSATNRRRGPPCRLWTISTGYLSKSPLIHVAISLVHNISRLLGPPIWCLWLGVHVRSSVLDACLASYGSPFLPQRCVFCVCFFWFRPDFKTRISPALSTVKRSWTWVAARHGLMPPLPLVFSPINDLGCCTIDTFVRGQRRIGLFNTGWKSHHLQHIEQLWEKGRFSDCSK